MSDVDCERAAFRVVPISALPDTGVDLDGWHGAAVNWYAVSDEAVRIFESGVDPLDHDEIQRRLAGSRLGRRQRGWAKGLFSQPVVLYAHRGRWGDGRHRTEAMRKAGVLRCLVQLLD